MDDPDEDDPNDDHDDVAGGALEAARRSDARSAYLLGELALALSAIAALFAGLIVVLLNMAFDLGLLGFFAGMVAIPGILAAAVLGLALGVSGLVMGRRGCWAEDLAHRGTARCGVVLIMVALTLNLVAAILGGWAVSR